ncbi:D-lyxose/D-mannose family sugar isomerase [Pectinatus frisingensis]|uniref:D-lyxose/D-mannose family sugar isomerase n=1 Tax=Pectinatus frisingensis TaxID=865 RepID=UPI0018C6228A|nr:D-lyxose/D-mannose family sugar isomerase [Pectinatus frisingensis]
MKRSEINKNIQYIIDKAKDFHILLPSFAFYTLDDWKNIKKEECELVDTMLGWGITDFGKGNYNKCGLGIFTFRNGSQLEPQKYPKPYCEKLLFVSDGQMLPYHFHFSKMEDIINRGGGILEITLYNADGKEDFADTDVTVTIDGKKSIVHAGASVQIKPGQSITLLPRQYHSWHGIPGTGDIAVFEVSRANDDNIDNRFYDKTPWVPAVDEDEPIKYLVFDDYKKYVNF